MAIYGRTDLALEAVEIFQGSSGDKSALEGVKASRQLVDGIDVALVDILNEAGAGALGKRVGKYYTMELTERFERGSELFPRAAQTMAELISRCISGRGYKRFLIAALGNPDISPDALGSLTAGNIIVTRHLKEHMPSDFQAFADVALCRPGVLGTTGIESAAQIKCLCRELKPQLVIAVDALAGAELSRLGRCFQLSTAGISPGSGVGNNRQELSAQALGVPVLAIGVPTVLDAGMLSDLPQLKNMFVTSRDIDFTVRSAARLIGYGINLALNPGLTVSDVDMLLG